MSILLPNDLRNRFSTLVLVAADAFALVASITATLLLRFEGLYKQAIYQKYLSDHIVSFSLTIGLYVGIFYAFRLYRYAWRFAGIETLWAVVCCNTIGLMGLIVLQTAIDGHSFPRSVLIMFWAASIIAVGTVRVALRLINVSYQRHKNLARRITPANGTPRRVIILGGGHHGVTIMKAFCDDTSITHELIGFLDDDPGKIGAFIGQVKVLGPINYLTELVERNAVDEVIVALPEINAEAHKQIMACRKAKVCVKVVPRLRDVLNDRSFIHTEDFSVEDLLRRASRRINIEEIGEYLTGKRVLVTGAGGSIGSELCRQIVALRPASLVLVGHGENSIFDIRQELQRDFPEMADRIYWVIASVSNEFRINQIFDSFSPQVVFHAAAHKHVPIMESNLLEAVHNNVLGTTNIADACGCCGVERMVLISTDKAANPSSVMGATKWMCEEVVRAAAATWPQTTYVTVRFGNVLGSRGSVVPVFRKQIEQGGPVTVTHPEMTRYFMTIPEASRLVLQAGAVGSSGDLYLLDMGNPVKIVDLAKDMIRLYGLEPDVDIPIQFSGIRSGEKLHEKLTSEDEEIEKAEWDGLFVVHRQDYFAPTEMLDTLQRMKQLITYGDEAGMLDVMHLTVPGFAGQRRVRLITPAPKEEQFELGTNETTDDSMKRAA